MKKLLNAVFLILIFNESFAQLDVIKGTITDAETNQALPFAHIYFTQLSVGKVSGSDGKFEFKISEGLSLPDTLVVKYIGYAEYRFPLLSIPETAIEIELKPDGIMLSEVALSEKRLKFDAQSFAEEALALYQKNVSDAPHLAYVLYAERIYDQNKIIASNLSKGFAVYVGENNQWTPLARYKFIADKTRVAAEERKLLNLYRMSKSGQLRFSGGNNVNLFAVLNSTGILSKSSSNEYEFKLVEIKPLSGWNEIIMSFKGNEAKGTIIFYDDMRLKTIVFDSKKTLWSNIADKRVPAAVAISFEYYSNVPFFKEITTNYDLGSIQHKQTLRVLSQKFSAFSLTDKEIGNVNRMDLFPVVYYDSDDWTAEELARYLNEGLLDERFHNVPAQELKKHDQTVYFLNFDKQENLDAQRALLDFFRKIVLME